MSNTSTASFGPNMPACPQGEEYDGCRTVGDMADQAEAHVRTYMAPIEEKVEDDHCADAIANILHLCDKLGLDTDAVLESARTRWSEERGGSNFVPTDDDSGSGL